MCAFWGLKVLGTSPSAVVTKFGPIYAIKWEVRIISYYLGLGYERVVCTLCLPMFCCFFKAQDIIWLDHYTTKLLKGSNMIVCVLLVSNSRGCCLTAPGNHEGAGGVIILGRDNTRGNFTPTIHTQMLHQQYTHNHVWSLKQLCCVGGIMIKSYFILCFEETTEHRKT